MNTARKLPLGPLMIDVEGTTLREWQKEKQRPWQEILRMYLGAGEGLRAAHEVGLIHRGAFL